MKIKILKYSIGIIIIIILLMITLVFRPNLKNENTDENKTIKEQVDEILSIEETDSNIIGYIT